MPPPIESGTSMKKKIKEVKEVKEVIIDLGKCISITSRKYQCTAVPTDGAYCKRHATIIAKALATKIDKETIAKDKATIAILKLELASEEAKTRQATHELETRKISDMMDMLGQMSIKGWPPLTKT
ncbi:hypothetical protein T492DRAFT_847889 [Pavlovales sp. CCMP2436]|nr:hypothetical protein T492DRAFT_847889 [Pavlovales sp. CCMP2436]